MTNYTDNMNLDFILTTTQKKKINSILDELAHHMGNYSNDYELRNVEVKRFNENVKTIMLTAYCCLKTATTTCFSSYIHVFISARGQVTYYSNNSFHVYKGSNIFKLICANQ